MDDVTIYYYLTRARTEVAAAAAADIHQTAWILDHSMFALDLINNNLGFHLPLALAQKQSWNFYT